MKIQFYTMFLLVVIGMCFNSCNKKSPPQSQDDIKEVEGSQVEAIHTLEDLPQMFEDLSNGDINIDDLFDRIDPSKFKGKEDYIVRFVTSNARYAASSQYLQSDMLIASDTTLASYIYKNYPYARKFYETHNGKVMLNLEKLVDALSFIEHS